MITRNHPKADPKGQQSQLRTKKKLLRAMVNRRDTFPVLLKNRISRIVPISGVTTVLASHITGRGKLGYRLPGDDRERHATGLRVGSYTPTPGSNTTKWGCIDLDGAGHENKLDDPLSAALTIHGHLKEQGIPVYLEKSGGGHGWHLWIFFERAVSAVTVRALLNGVLVNTGHLKNGRLATGIEVFPKSDTVSEEGFGNYVWLPFWHASPEGCGEFYAVGPDGTLSPCLPSAFEKVPSTLLPKLRKPRRTSVKKESIRKVRSRVSKRSIKHQVDPPKEGKTALPGFRAWRKEALDRLPLEQIYGSWLTGRRSGQNWLQCRDPFAAGGDHTPSAGVSDGTGRTERGRFVSFRDGGARLSVFDFLVKAGRASDHVEACRVVADLSGVPLPGRGLRTWRRTTNPESRKRKGHQV